MWICAIEPLSCAQWIGPGSRDKYPRASVLPKKDWSLLAHGLSPFPRNNLPGLNSPLILSQIGRYPDVGQWRKKGPWGAVKVFLLMGFPVQWQGRKAWRARSRRKGHGSLLLSVHFSSFWQMLIYSYESQICIAKQPQVTSSAADTLASHTPAVQHLAGLGMC